MASLCRVSATFDLVDERSLSALRSELYRRVIALETEISAQKMTIEHHRSLIVLF
jgi:hypothetical protein